MRLHWVRRFWYWLFCLALSAFVPMNISEWFHHHQLINRGGWIGGAVGALAGALVLANRDQATQSGARRQSRGIMAQADNVRVRALRHSVSQTHAISDADLDWTVVLLRGADNSIARALAMVVLLKIHPMSGAQQAKVALAIAPYLNSPDRLDKLVARRVESAMSAATS